MFIPGTLPLVQIILDTGGSRVVISLMVLAEIQLYPATCPLLHFRLGRNPIPTQSSSLLTPQEVWGPHVPSCWQGHGRSPTHSHHSSQLKPTRADPQGLAARTRAQDLRMFGRLDFGAGDSDVEQSQLPKFGLPCQNHASCIDIARPSRDQKKSES